MVRFHLPVIPVELLCDHGYGRCSLVRSLGWFDWARCEIGHQVAQRGNARAPGAIEFADARSLQFRAQAVQLFNDRRRLESARTPRVIRSRISAMLRHNQRSSACLDSGSRRNCPRRVSLNVSTRI
jgi:hypothetical protein